MISDPLTCASANAMLEDDTNEAISDCMLVSRCFHKFARLLVGVGKLVSPCAGILEGGAVVNKPALLEVTVGEKVVAVDETMDGLIDGLTEDGFIDAHIDGRIVD